MRTGRSTNTRRFMLAAITCVGITFIGLPITHAHAGPFAGFTGTWSGGGSVRLFGGKSEKIRCRAYYTPKSSGRGLGMAIRCASAGNKFELRAQLNGSGRSVSGSWEERTFNTSGRVSGTASSGKMKLRINGPVQGSVSISTKGRKQWVSIATSTSDGSGSMRISIKLKRRG